MPLTSDSRFEEFWEGLTSPLRVIRLLLRHPQLLGLFILPMAITLIFLSTAIYLILTGFWSLAHGAISSWLGSGLAGYGAGLMSVVMSILLIYLSFQSLQLLIQLAASPFNDLLAERTERALEVSAGAETGILHLANVLLIDLRKTILALVVTGVLLLWGLVPVFGVLSFLGMALVQAFTFLSYPQSRRKMGLQQSILWMITHLPRTLGLGIACLILMSIPFLNLFALPVCVMAGTLTYLKK